jgi:two-component system, NarL family, nitrate/nitrite response regulator NarL
MTGGRISVLIAGPVRLYRDGLAAILAREDGFGVAGTAGEGSETVSWSRQLAPDVVLVDLALADCVEAIRAIAGQGEVKIAALVSPDTERRLIGCAEAGVSNFVTRDDSIAELVATIRSAACGGSRISSLTAAAVVRNLAGLAAERVGPVGEQRLTAREAQVMGLIERGFSNKEIARELSVALPTVKQHVHHILEKLQVSRRGEAVARMRAGSTP